MEDLTGRQFGQYQIVAPLGEGGMAAVYKAYQPTMERYVAIKVLPQHMAASAEFVARFRREAKMLAQLQHPNILPVFDYGEADGYPYIVMPFVQSGTLAELLHKRRVSLAEVRRLMTQIGEALSYAHARGMIHRDIKPSNMLIDERGNCLLTDFGLARMVEASTKITTSGTIMGTPAYMSPEQGTGAELDQRSDIYSLGIILYEMVTGRVPYTAETPVAVVFKHIQDPLPSARKLNPNLPEAVEVVLLKALAKHPEERYQTADDFVQAIQKAIPEIDAPDKVITSDATLMDSAAPTAISSASAGANAASKAATASRFSMWALAGFGAIVVIAVVMVLGRNMFAAKILPTPTTADLVVETVAPTNSPVPLATSTLEPTFVPGTSTPLVINNPLQNLNDIQVLDTDTFDNPLEGQWNVDVGAIKDGALEIIGNENWDGVSRKRTFREGEGVVMDFSYTGNSLFEVFWEYGDWDTNPYRRFGVYVGDNNVDMNEYAGKNDLGGENLTESFTLEPGRTYSLLLAILPEGEFAVAVWEPSDPLTTIYHRESKDDTWSSLTWTFWIQANSGVIYFDNFQEIKFSGVK